MRALLILMAVLMACGTKPAAKTPLVGWRPIDTFSGHGNAQTESFNIETGAWRIKWEAKNETSPGTGLLLVTVHSAVSGRPIAQAVEHRGPGHDIAYVTDDPRLYHLVIESHDVDWSLKVEEAVTAYAP